MSDVKPVCGQCKYYKKVQGRRQGYCTSSKSYYYELKVGRSQRAADRCFARRAENA